MFNTKDKHCRSLLLYFLIVFSSKFCPISFLGLNVEASTLFTPLPDNAFDVTNLIRNHNQRLLRSIPYNPKSGILPLNKKLSKDLLSYHYSFEHLPQCLQNHYPTEHSASSRCSLIDCITDETPNSQIYPVQFQIVKALSVPTREGINASHAVLEIQDPTAKINVIVPHEEEEESHRVEFTLKDSALVDNKILKSLEGGAFRASLRSFENYGIKYFVLEGSLVPL